MKFEKISYEQFEKDMIDCYFAGNEITDIDRDFISKAYESIKLPERATAGSAGYDFFLPYGMIISYDEDVKFPTGIKVQLDPDKVLMCYPRSGLGFKCGFRLLNTTGVIDSDYYNNPNNEGHIFAKMRMEKKGAPMVLCAGDAFMQGVIQQYFTVDDDDVTADRVGGLGSTSR